MTSTVHDPSTVHHRTYFEYMNMLRTNSVCPETILPFTHTQKLEKWLSTIKKPDADIVDKIKSLHPGKYDEWLDRALKKGLMNALRKEIMSLSDEKKSFISLNDTGEGGYEFSYDAFILSALKRGVKDVDV